MIRILSGIQPTGIPHLGNYLGAIKPWVDIQNTIYNPLTLNKDRDSKQSDKVDIRPQKMKIFIADLHSLTVKLPSRSNGAENSTLNTMAAALIACGLDPRKTHLFRQSRVRGHSDLFWVLCCNTPEKGITNPNIGMLSYPILQAADILIYGTTHVPVGDDQSQHLNLTRDIAVSLNQHYKTSLFHPPKSLFSSAITTRIKSLLDPEKKMSKSDPNPNSRIEILDEPDVVYKKIKKAVTDSKTGISYDETRPGIKSLLDIYFALDLDQHMDVDVDVDEKAKSFSLGAILKPKAMIVDINEMRARTAPLSHLSHEQFKKLVSDRINSHLAPIRSKFTELNTVQGQKSVETALRKAESEVASDAKEMVEKVYRLVGL